MRFGGSMEKENFINEAGARLAEKGAACGDLLYREDILRETGEGLTDAEDMLSLLRIIAGEGITVVVLRDDEIPGDKKAFAKKIRNSCEEEKKANMSGVNTVEAYLSDIGSLCLPSGEEEMKLMDDIADGDENAVGELISCGLVLPVVMSEKYIGRGVLYMDLVQEGNLALMNAAESFDFNSNISFFAFAAMMIDAALRNAVSEWDTALNIPSEMTGDAERIRKEYNALKTEKGREPTSREIAERLAPGQKAPEDVPIRQKKQEPEETVSGEEALSGQVREMLAALPEREAMVISMRYGLGGKPPMTCGEIAEAVSLDIGDVRRAEENAMRILGK